MATTTFRGQAKRLAKGDFEAAAARLFCDVAAVRSVAEVESGGRSGFLPDKRPKILFESRLFHELTRGIYDANADISTPTWVRNYKGGGGEYTRLAKAIRLDRTAALKATSWGMFQILGTNHRACGFLDVESYVDAQLVSEGAHLQAFVGFVVTNKLDDELRDRRWADFARGYNGPGYRQNHYDEKIAAAYAKYTAGWMAPSTEDLQRALNRNGASLVVDGVTGPATREAIRDFQRRHGLAVDGLAGPKTLAALGLSETHDAVEVSRVVNA